MNKQLGAHLRRRQYSECRDSLSSDVSSDDLTESEDKHDVLSFLKTQGDKYLDTFEGNSENVNKSEGKPPPAQLGFNTLLHESSECILESIEDSECLSVENEESGEISSENVDETEVDVAMRNISPFTSSDDMGSTKVDCFNCADVRRITVGVSLMIGSHIKFGRYAPSLKTNNFLKRKLKGKLGFLYFHHAIITEIIKEDKNKVTITLVEFTTRTSTEGKLLIEVTENYMEDLDLEEDFVFVIDYKHLPFTPEEIVQRARSLKGKKAYGMFTNNCEHVALWCVTNLKASFQSDSSMDACKSWFTWFSAMISKVTHLTVFSKDIASATKSLFIRVSAGTLAASVCCPIVCAIVECILLIRRLKQLKSQLMRRLICLCCFNKKKLKILAKLVVGFLVSISLIIPSIKYTVPVIVAGVVALVAVPWAFQILITKIKAKINPTSIVPHILVHSMSDIQPGDILSIESRMSSHDIVVEKITLVNREEDFNVASLDVVHYTFRGLFGTRTVAEEHFDFNLDKEDLIIYSFPDDKTFSLETTAKRARKKIGEQRFNTVTRRSSHMAWECKVLPNVNVSYMKRKATNYYDVEEGDVIEFKYCWLPHAAVVTRSQSYKPSDLVQLTYIHVDKSGNVIRNVETIDLEKTFVYIQIYEQNKIDSNIEVVEKARKFVGKKAVCKQKYFKSSHFALFCKLKDQEDEKEWET